ncbi:DEAD/DEAH box helicase [Brachybacterium sp. DNPG3]
MTADLHFGFVDYTTPSQRLYHPTLVRNDDSDTMLRAIKHELRHATSFLFSVAFLTPGALGLLKQDLLDFPGQGTIITSDYLGFNHPNMFRELLQFPQLEVRVVESDAGFHAKGYLFQQGAEQAAIIGSSNLTRNALLVNEEWNLRFSAMPDGDITRQLSDAIAAQRRRSIPLSYRWIDEYAARWDPQNSSAEREAGLPSLLPTGTLYPNAMQAEALDAIQAVRDAGSSRALVVSATGTGKTILAAFATRAINPPRFLFVAHREQILSKAREEFARVLPGGMDGMSLVAGGRAIPDTGHVFATVQSLSRPSTLETIDPHDFDLVIVDEVHRSGAASYLRFLDHLSPRFLLGLTATPERTDSFNVFELFDYTVPYEIRLQQALENDMLAPFTYYGVDDYVDEEGNTVGDDAPISRLAGPERTRHIVQTLEQYGHVGDAKGLIFCSRIEEAQQLSRRLNDAVVHGARLRTRALSGADPLVEREAAVAALENGDLDYLLTVDIFNEGIDIPSVNQVVMLRQTQSSIVFTQQLGRGLRKAVGKDHLRVIDFIGNYANNFMIPIALFGDSSLNKDVLRKKIIEAETAGSIAGVSSVTFQPVARQRIFDALSEARLDSMPNLKRALHDLEQRLGTVPRLYDFARFETVDPVLIATKRKTNYWDFLVAAKKVDVAPVVSEQHFLTFLSFEILNGKRPHELLILQHLLRTTESSVRDLEVVLETQIGEVSTASFASAIRLLDYSFSIEQEKKRYGQVGVLTRHQDRIRLTPEFATLYQAGGHFAAHVDDVIETGLHLARHRYSWNRPLTVGERYSRKDACRLLNWGSNQQGVIFGYKLDPATNTCPVFVTYHKDDQIADSLAYGDEFLDQRNLRWFTRSGLTLQSKEVRALLDTESPADLHVFVKKDDAESSEFYYLGQARPHDAQEETMPSAKGVPHDVVTMRLALDSPVGPHLYDYLTSTTKARVGAEHRENLSTPGARLG